MTDTGLVFNSSTNKIQSIFNDTALKILKTIGNSKSADSSSDTRSVAEIIPILQTFLLDIQMCHTQVFNGIVNSVQARQPLLQEDIRQPEVTAKWQTINTKEENPAPLQGFIMDDINSKPVWPMTREHVNTRQPESPAPAYSVASQETRRHWGSRSPIQQSSTKPNGYIGQQTNYDDFIKYYTNEYANYNSTYLEDSSEDENGEAWKSLSDYVKSDTNSPSTDPNTASYPGLTNEPASSVQCCARLSKFMKYHIIDFPEDFLDAYPPDTYIEKGYVFGKPCSNLVTDVDVAAGIYFCHEHQFEIGIEDIRQPRVEYHKAGPNDDLEIEFSNTKIDWKEDWKEDAEGFDYYSGNTTSRHSSDGRFADGFSGSGGFSEGFGEGYQCCARLNKFRKYDITQESPDFLDTYPPNVYIENGNTVYGTACQNMISDDSFKAGIKYCIYHQSDPYVEDICEPRGILNRPSYSLKDGKEEAEMLGLTEVSIKNKQSSNIKKTGYEWDKYNSDFNYLC